MCSLEWILTLLRWCSSVRLSVCLGSACIVIVLCTSAQIYVYGWIVQYSGHPDTFSSSTWKRGGVWMYRADSRPGHSLWYRYTFLKQYHKLVTAVGLARLVGGEHMGDALVLTWLLLLGVRRYIIWRNTGWIWMVFGGVFWLDGLWLCWIYRQHHPHCALSLR